MNRKSLNLRGYAFLVLLWIQNCDVVLGIAFPNEITREPEVECGQDTISISVLTSNGLPSRIFAKGQHTTPGCFHESTGDAVFSLSGCNMNRQRQLEPRGLSYSLIVVVQLHPLFITKVDRAYSIRCFYMEADKSVSSLIDVSMVATETITAGHAMPQCMYVLHGETPNGPSVRYARVGDKVWHTWDCPSDVYGMLVHSCYVTDGQGSQIQILDENGCGVDQYVLRTPVYSRDLTRAQQETHTFKFADKISVRFNCQIKLCFKNGGGCDGITPPGCPDNGGQSGQIILTTQEVPNGATTLLFDDAGAQTTEEVSTRLSSAPPPPSEQSTTTESESLGVINPGTESASVVGENATLNRTTLTDELTSESLIPADHSVQTTTETPFNDTTTDEPITEGQNATEGEGDTLGDVGSGESPDESMEERLEPRGSLEAPQPLPDSVGPLSDVDVKAMALGLSRDDPIRALLHEAERQRDGDSDDFPLGTSFSEDIRGRRNARGPAMALIQQDSEISGGDLELDVNSEMFVLEPEELSPPSANRERGSIPRLRAISESSGYSGDEICMSTGGFGLVMTAFVVMIFACSAAIFFLCIRSRALKFSSSRNSIYSASSSCGAPSTSGSTQRLRMYNYRI